MQQQASPIPATLVPGDRPTADKAPRQAWSARMLPRPEPMPSERLQARAQTLRHVENCGVY